MYLESLNNALSPSVGLIERVYNFVENHLSELCYVFGLKIAKNDHCEQPEIGKNK